MIDRSKFIYVVHSEMTVDASDHYQFNKDLRTYRFKYRIAGQPILSAPILLADGSTQVSPYVQLDDVAS
jgi:hypothetical protein